MGITSLIDGLDREGRYDAAMDEVGSLIYAWRWSKRSHEVKFGQTKNGSGRFSAPSRPTEISPTAWEHLRWTHGEREPLGFVPVPVDDLDTAEGLLLDLYESHRLAGSEWFEVSTREVKAALALVARSFRSTFVSYSDERFDDPDWDHRFN